MEPTATKVVRIILGLLLVLFGLNKFFHYMPTPAPEGAAALCLGGLAQSGFFFPMLGAVEAATGTMLLAGAFVPLALIILAPVSLNIVLFHAFLAPGSMVGPGLLIAILNAYLGWANVDAYRGLLKIR